MHRIEKLLEQEKEHLDRIKVPEQMEGRLQSALMDTSPKRQVWHSVVWKAAIAAVLLTLIIGSNFNALAYYSKKILGVDPVLNGTLKQLNEEGLGQPVDETITLTNETKFTVNGVMTDENQLILFYTMANPDGLGEQQVDVYLRQITGFATDSFASGGTGTLNEDETEYTGMLTFDPVSPFAKKLTLHIDEFIESSHTESYTLTFDYNPSLAMQTELKQTIKKKVHVDKGTVKFDSITATPTVTIIEGSLSVDNYDRVSDTLGGVQLFVDGEEINLQGGGLTSTITGAKFDIHYDALPEKFDSLQLVVNKFAGYEKVDKRISLNETEKPFILYNDKHLWIKDIRMTSQGIEMTIATEGDVLLDGVSIETDGEITPLKTTLTMDYVEQEGTWIYETDPEQSLEHEEQLLLKERIILFETKEEPEYIHINGIHYMKVYDEVIDIPLK